MMKWVSLAARIGLGLVALFFLIMSFDVFVMEDYSFGEQLAGWFINASPGILLGLLLWGLWRKPVYLGGAVLAYGTALMWFFHVFQNWPERAIVLFVVIVPLYLAGIVLLIDWHMKRSEKPGSENDLEPLTTKNDKTG